MKMKNLKIGIVTYTVSFGGVGTFILSLAKKLEEKGNTVEVVCTDKRGAWYSLIRENGFNAYSFNFNLLRWIPFGRIIHSFRVGMFLKKKKYDLVIVNHSYFALASLPLYKNKSKIISVIHNQKPEVIKDDCINHEYIDAITCVSEKIHNEAIKIAPFEKVHTILNGIRLPAQNLIDKRVSFNLPLKLLYVGRLDNHQKAILLLPEIIKIISKNKIEISLTIIGDGPDKEKLLELISKYKLNSFINYKGLLTNEEVYKEYLSNHILLLPSNYEGLPLTLIEAMACGCVPIATMLEGSTDLCIDEGVNGFLTERGNCQEVADKVLQIYSNSKSWELMSSNSIEKAKKDFSFETMAHKYFTIIDKIFSKNENLEKNALFRISASWKDIFPYHLIMNTKKIFKN